MVDLTHLVWDDSCTHGSSFGMLNKSEATDEDDVTWFYKMSRMQGSHVVGYESIMEYIVSRYLDVLQIPHVQYELIDALVKVHNKEIRTWLCRSKNYCGSMEAISIQDYCNDKQKAEHTIIKEFGRNYLDVIYLVDFLICNTDRHGHNIEIIKTDDGKHLAPLFDHGCSLLYWAPNENSVVGYDVMSDVPTNNYIGAESLYENLHTISTPIRTGSLTQHAKSYIFYGVTKKVLPQGIIDKTWEMIWRRYNYAKDKNFLTDRCEAPTEASSYFSST